MFGGTSNLTEVLAYTKAHGGGTVAVSSQQGASTAIIRSDADVAGIGGFSGRESEPSVSWFSQEVGNGNIRWVLTGGQMGGGLGGDGRAGSNAVMTAVAERLHRDPVVLLRGHHGHHHLRQHELERALRLPWQGRRAG